MTAAAHAGREEAGPEPSAPDVVAEVFARAGDVVQQRQLSAGDVVIRHAAAVDGLYRVVSGVLEASVEQAGRRLVLGHIGPGEVAGEMSLLAGGLSTATVTAPVDTVVDWVPATAARDMVAQHAGLSGRLSDEAVARADRNSLVLLLVEITDADEATSLAATVDELPLRRLQSGEVLFREDDPARAAFLVVSGRLAVRARPRDTGSGEALGSRDVGDHDGQRELSRVGRGQVVGESALFDRQSRSTTVVAVRDSVVAEVSKDVFYAFLAANPVAMGRITRQLVTRMARPTPRGRHRVSTVAVVSTMPVNTRVAATQVADALAPFGAVGHLNSARVDADLLHPGIAQSELHDPGASRLAAHLHEFELAHDFVVLEVGRDEGGWARRALGMADRVLVLISAAPDEQERRRIETVLPAVPSETTVVAVAHHQPDVARPSGSAALKAELGVQRLLHARFGVRADLERAARIAASCAVGVAFGGGGARGFAHVGALRALLDSGVPVDLVAGASIGAPIAGAVACGVGPGPMVALLRRLFHDLLDYTVPVVSLVRGERITQSIRNQFDGWDFEDLWLPFACVSTNLTRSRSELHRHGPVTPAVRASVAIPGVMPPVPFGEDLLVDGGVLDNLPVDVLADEGVCGTIIAVDVAPPEGPRARSDYGLSVSGWQALRASLGRGRSGFPGITAILMRTMMVASQRDRTRVLEQSSVDLLLELDLRGVGLLDFDNVDPVVERGHQQASALVKEWLADADLPWSRS